MDQPFMLFFAENRSSQLSDEFLFLSPKSDSSMNSIGELRVDPDSARRIPMADVFNNSWMLKTLSIGTALDVEVVSKIIENTEQTISKYWSEENGLFSRRGYTVGRNPDQDSSKMKVLPDLSSPNGPERRFTIEVDNYAKFKHDFLTRTRLFRKGDQLQPYRAPLFVLKKSLPKNRNEGNSRTCYQDIAFNQDHYGYSASKHANGKLLVQYLNLFAHCNVWTFFALCTSSSLGTERPVFLKSDFDGCPFIPPEELDQADQHRIEELALKLEQENESVFDEIDSFFSQLYGLDNRDLQVISDTLEVRNPHDELGKRGSSGIRQPEEERFLASLNELLKPFASRIGVRLDVKTIGSSESASYRFIEIKDADLSSQIDDTVDASTLELATQTGASRIIRFEKGRVVVGILNQYRYWTPSRARLLAADVLREYFSAFEGVQ